MLFLERSHKLEAKNIKLATKSTDALIELFIEQRFKLKKKLLNKVNT